MKDSATPTGHVQSQSFSINEVNPNPFADRFYDEPPREDDIEVSNLQDMKVHGKDQNINLTLISNLVPCYRSFLIIYQEHSNITYLILVSNLNLDMNEMRNVIIDMSTKLNQLEAKESKSAEQESSGWPQLNFKQTLQNAKVYRLVRRLNQNLYIVIRYLKICQLTNNY